MESNPGLLNHFNSSGYLTRCQHRFRTESSCVRSEKTGLKPIKKTKWEEKKWRKSGKKENYVKEVNEQKFTQIDVFTGSVGDSWVKGERDVGYSK